MIPITGTISMNDINVELGNSGTANISVADALTTMGEAGNPDTMEEMRGYDNDWKNVGCGWLEPTYSHVTPMTPGPGYIFDIRVTNKSQVNTQSETVYWRARNGSTTLFTSAFTTGTLNPNTNTTPSIAHGGTYSVPDDVQISYDNSNWISVISFVYTP